METNADVEHLVIESEWGASIVEYRLSTPEEHRSRTTATSNNNWYRRLDKYSDEELKEALETWKLMQM